MLRRLARFLRRIVQEIGRSRSGASMPAAAKRSEALPTAERYSFVLERIKAYRAEMLSYEIGIERYRRHASQESLMRALALDNELPEVRSMPVLYLNSDEWVWDQQQLRQAVLDSIDELGLQVPDDVNEPTAQAAHACDRWAAAEAKRRFGEVLRL